MQEIFFKWSFNDFITTEQKRKLNIVNYYNTIEHTNTKFIPIDIKDTKDPDLINAVNENKSKTKSYANKNKDCIYWI